MFSQLNKYQSRETLSLNEAFIVANLARKLLESFLSFKFPKHRNDFHALIETAVSDKVMREKVYRFINKYSHAAQIDIYDPSIESLLGEGGFIVSDVLKIVEDLDGNHYAEMMEIVA